MKSTTRIRSDWSVPRLQWHFRSPYPPTVQRALGELCLRLAAVERIRPSTPFGDEIPALLRLAERFGVPVRKVAVFGMAEAVRLGLYRLIHLRTRDPLLEVLAEFMASRNSSASVSRPGRIAMAVGWFQFRCGLQAMGASRREFVREVRAVCRPRTIDPCFISGTYAEGAR